MKKYVIITIVAILIIGIIVGITAVVTIKNINEEKPSITASDFYDLMEQKGFVLKEERDQLEEYNFINKVYIAINSEYNYQIEFYEFNDDYSAINFYNDNKSSFNSSKSDISLETNEDLKNYSKYTVLTDERYKVVSRINNTVIDLDVDEDYEETVKSILDELGY